MISFSEIELFFTWRQINENRVRKVIVLITNFWLNLHLQLVESLTLNDMVPDQPITVIEYLPKRFLLLDGLHRLCALIVLTVLQQDLTEFNQLEFQYQCHILWPSM